MFQLQQLTDLCVSRSAAVAMGAEEESSVAHTFGSLAPDWAAEEGQEGQQQQQPRGKRGAPAAKQPPGGGGKRSKPQRGRGSAEGSEADSGAVPAGRAAAAKPAGTPSRQQPRRGAKSEIGAKLKEASTDVEDEEEEGVSWDDDSQEEQQHTGTLRGAAVPSAARAVVTLGEQAEAGRVVLRRATAVAIAADAVRVSAPAAAGRLRADTDEEGEEEVGEEEKEREEEEAEEQEPHQRTQRQRQQLRRPQKPEQGTVSPNQENRAAANGLAAARGRQQKASTRAAAAPKPSASKAGGSNAQSRAAKPQLKRTRA